MLSQKKHWDGDSTWLSKPAAHYLTHPQWKKTPSFADLTFWSSQNHWELSHMNKLGNWDGISILRQKWGERGAKIVELTFLCNSQPDLKNSFLLKEQKVCTNSGQNQDSKSLNKLPRWSLARGQPVEMDCLLKSHIIWWLFLFMVYRVNKKITTVPILVYTDIPILDPM